MRVASIPFQKLRYEIRTREIEMASGSGPTSFQTHLERFAASVGYKEKIRGLPKEASGNIKVAHFLKWLEEQLVTSNTLSQFELERSVSLRHYNRQIVVINILWAFEKNVPIFCLNTQRYKDT